MKELWRDIKAFWDGGDRRERTYVAIAAVIIVAEVWLAIDVTMYAIEVLG